jgi:hypothetical protein
MVIPMRIRMGIMITNLANQVSKVSGISNPSSKI